MVVSAEKARAKAEARRQRILAKAGQRLDVVSGLAPMETVVDKSSSVSGGDGNGNVGDDAPAVAAPVADAVEDGDKTTDGGNDDNNDATTTAENVEASEETEKEAMASSSAGARRMAAMRRRRYQQKKVKEEEDAADADDAAQNEGENEATTKVADETSNNKEHIKMQEKDEVKPDATADDAAAEPIETTANEKEPKQKAAEEEEEEEAKEPTTPKNETQQVEEEPPTPEPSSPPTEEKKDIDNNDNTNTNDDDHKPKKYMGVARMRRKLLKEQKAQRLKQLQDDSTASADMRGVDAAAEMATMAVTASMIRQGSMSVNNEDGKSGAGDLSGIAEKSMAMKRGYKKSWWWRMFVPPMHLVPRLVTLGLLLMAGLDMGLGVHSKMGSGGSVKTTSSMIGHVETSITKPWEYGMGGKVAYMVGMAPSAPPTALPTSFTEGYCAFGTNGEEGNQECLSRQEKSTATSKPGKKSGIINKFSMEDEFDSSRGSSMTTSDKTTTTTTTSSGNTRPRGVASHDHSEFDDDTLSTNKVPNIDPLFRVDLDNLLENAQLPFPLSTAARLAIGFHRTWVYYLWTLPLSTVKSVLSFPKNLLSGWIRDPPVIFAVCMVVRLIHRILVGSGKSFSMDGSGADDLTSLGGSGNAGKSGKGNNLDVLGKMMDTAKNYVGDSFPRTKMVFGTLMGVMKVDMYVVFFGMLVGLVVPLTVEEHDGLSSWWNDVKGRLGIESSVLGDGEL